MTWPIPWVILDSPKIDMPNPNYGESIGVMPAHSADPLAIQYRGENSPSADIPQFSFAEQAVRPVCIPVPWPYDDAGVAFPPGSVAVIAGLIPGAFGGQFGYLQGSGGTGSVQLSNFQSIHMWPVRVRVWGLDPAASGTVTIRHVPGYGSGTPTIDDFTFSFNGANGPDQEGVLPSVLSAPSDHYNSATWYAQDSWSGPTPPLVVVDWGRDHIALAHVVPTAVPGDFTPRADEDSDRGAHWGTVDRGYDALYRMRAAAVHVSNRRFNLTGGVDTIGRVSVTGPVFFFTEDINKRMGAACSYPDGSTSNGSHVFPLQGPNSYPYMWLGDALYMVKYMGRAFGPRVTGPGDPTFSVASTKTAGSYTIPDGNPQGYMYGPGFRNLRMFVFNDFNVFTLGDGTAKIDSVTVKVYLDGVLFTTKVYTGPFTDKKHFDVTNIYPVGRNDKCEVSTISTLEYTVTSPTSCSVFISGSLIIKASPRCDIPMPWTAVGFNGDAAPGGYLPSALQTPKTAGDAPQHAPVGATTVSFSVPPLTANAVYACTFVPPTTGVWTILSTGPTGFAYGEFEFRIQTRSSQIGRANKRFWGYNVASASAAFTWTLTPVTQIQTAIPGGGLTINSGMLTDGHWFFGYIDFPAAGTYQITAQCVTGAGLLLAASQGDPYVANHQDGPNRIKDGPATPGTTISVVVGVTSPGRWYVRYGAYDPYYRSTSDSPFAGGASGPIAWALI